MMNIFLRCVRKLSVDRIQTGNMDPPPPGFWKAVAIVTVLVISPVVINALIGFREVPKVHCDWLQVNHLKVLVLSFVKCIFRSGRDIDL